MEEFLQDTEDDVWKELEEVESDIKSYQSLLGSMTKTFDECGEGCYSNFKSYRKLDSDYFKLEYEELFDSDRVLKTYFDQDINASKLRQVKEYCKDQIGDLREERKRLLSQRDSLEKQISMDRHLKK